MNTLLFIVLMTGFASQYDPGVMQGVLNVHYAGRTSYMPPQDLSPYDGFMAMESCAELGNEYWMRPVGAQWELFLVTDCSGHLETTNWMLRNNILAEVDFSTAARWGTVGKGIQIEMAEAICTKIPTY